MQKTILLTAFTLLIGSSVVAQNRSRVFDNFDTMNGVRVVTPTVEPIVSAKPAKTEKSTTNGKSKMYPGDGMGLTTSNSNSSKLRMGSSKHLKGFTTGSLEIDSYIIESSKRYSIDPLLIYSQMHQESAFKLKATSYKGASGLMQLMPATARRFGVTKIYDPEQNIDAGVKYMRWLLDKFGGDVVLALAGYNAGEGAVMKYGWQVPPYNETREYVRRISSRYTQISNPTYAQSVKEVDNTELAEIEKEEPKSLKIVEVEVMTVRLPDGRMRLVTR